MGFGTSTTILRLIVACSADVDAGGSGVVHDDTGCGNDSGDAGYLAMTVELWRWS